MPVASSEPIYESFSKQEILRMLIKSYQRTANSKIDRYELTRRIIRRHHTKPIGKRKKKIF